MVLLLFVLPFLLSAACFICAWALTRRRPEREFRADRHARQVTVGLLLAMGFVWGGCAAASLTWRIG